MDREAFTPPSPEAPTPVPFEQQRRTLISNLQALEGAASAKRLRDEAEQQNPENPPTTVKVDRARVAVLDRLSERAEELTTERQVAIAARIAKEVAADNSFNLEVANAGSFELIDFVGNDLGLKGAPSFTEVCAVLGLPEYQGSIDEALDRKQIRLEEKGGFRRYVIGKIEVATKERTLGAEVSFIASTNYLHMSQLVCIGAIE